MPFLFTCWSILQFDKWPWVPDSLHFQAHPRRSSWGRAMHQGQRDCPTAASCAKAHLALHNTHPLGKHSNPDSITQWQTEAMSAFWKAEHSASVQEGTCPLAGADHVHKFSFEVKLNLLGIFPAQCKLREGNSGWVNWFLGREVSLCTASRRCLRRAHSL